MFSATSCLHTLLSCWCLTTAKPSAFLSPRLPCSAWSCQKGKHVRKHTPRPFSKYGPSPTQSSPADESETHHLLPSLGAAPAQQEGVPRLHKDPLSESGPVQHRHGQGPADRGEPGILSASAQGQCPLLHCSFTREPQASLGDQAFHLQEQEM